MNWAEIRKEYETSTITLKALAEMHDIKLGTLKSRKSREGWLRDATQNKKVATINKKDATPTTKQNEIIESLVEPDELTEKQRLFCIYYVKSFNATQSAIKAGYSPDTAHVQGHENLRKPKIGKYIRELKGTMTNELFIDAMDVLQKYIKIAFADITDYATFGKKEVPAMGMFGPIEDDEGNPVMQEVNYVDFKESYMVDGTIITEVKQGKDGISVKLADKMKALDKLSLYFDLFPDKFKREIEREKLKITQKKVNGEDEEEYEDDGFLEALESKVSEVWNDVEED
jgi:phage terminase small subunit